MAAAMARRERIYEAIAVGIWGTAIELTPAQVDEAYRVADLVLAADPQTDDGAATPVRPEGGWEPQEACGAVKPGTYGSPPGGIPVCMRPRGHDGLHGFLIEAWDTWS